MKGYDYRIHAKIDRDPRELRSDMAEVLSAGETFIHGSNGLIVLEAYGYLPAPKAGA